MLRIDKILDEITLLDNDSKELLLEVLIKRKIESRRNEIAANAKKARKEFTHGKLASHSAKNLIDKLNK